MVTPGTSSLGLALLYQALFDVPSGLACTSFSRPIWCLTPLIPALSMLRQEEYKFRPHLGYNKTLF